MLLDQRNWSWQRGSTHNEYAHKHNAKVGVEKKKSKSVGESENDDHLHGLVCDFFQLKSDILPVTSLFSV